MWAREHCGQFSTWSGNSIQWTPVKQEDSRSAVRQGKIPVHSRPQWRKRQVLLLSLSDYRDRNKNPSVSYPGKETQKQSERIQDHWWVTFIINFLAKFDIFYSEGHRVEEPTPRSLLGLLVREFRGVAVVGLEYVVDVKLGLDLQAVSLWVMSGRKSNNGGGGGGRGGRGGGRGGRGGGFESYRYRRDRRDPYPPRDGYSIREFNEWRQSNAGWQILNIKYYFYYF